MIPGLAIILGASYIGYIGLKKPAQSASWLKSLSLDAALQTDEGRLERLMEIADKYYQTKDLMAAEKAYLRILKLDHNNFTAYYRLGLIYSYLNNNSDALECFELAAKIKPTATTLHNYGMTLFRYRDYAKAAEVLERANAKTPSFSRHITLARIYRILDQSDKQIEHLEAAAELEKNNIDVLTLLADAYLHNQRTDEAQQVFRSILRLDLNNKRALREVHGP